ncbi:bifunctional diaminohydroxyphosphoribosylaminopyrimidine deaminase/5-amino-6-(5-phosphoribosylamino)uracil reductase RibD [Clostridium cochlearium]|jgi:diaminohydroxyphosphoribosylaminopyrimidine deaminase/5-amino-6-(5-phosphoribosylamino)uracil reductase|uniref:bifunctional diaminohydroxyphosphoribosylaminopyrimidine deaminase/5-amino-6-(5-phosphoribosylamino)uracil reductase RibD n=1 Tax=Clostridium cochlearium TaxID=1494 RepID=UPI00242007A1|nr:bifunctional diaminohydroxyphosphoribosylaminopyrimidine deaminase/5-amino-6-(5-phosphoribosylamino)uracil reductase RibD [Clostridium cochlearium]MDU1443620.1 bifunctional diaminohydroxyphosphoribosylaminopyrimidine deaminase/5-amino-6-(5-phosphoribosylamino)uracil reductase RibD [Clostridium cochlearium]
MNLDEIYMKRAIELAYFGEGHVNPNPLVGAVIVKDGNVIGEGYHKKFGEAHAEIEAFKSCKEDPKGGTLYVNLEPCSHYGKTPPCVERIIKKGIKKVVIGMKDPNPLVAGRGIEILKKANIKVEVGVLEDECRKLNEIFIKYITHKKPFCILKWASTLDGKICSPIGDSKWITGEDSREYVHLIRNKVSSIMVGVNTIIKDNPSLTTRLKDRKGVNSTRIIVDSKGRTPLDARIFKEEGDTFIATTSQIEDKKIKEFEKIGSKIIITPEKDGRVDLQYLVNYLAEINIDSILLEGGGTLNYSALEEGIVDKVLIFIAPKILGGENSKTPVEGEGIKYVKDCIKLKDLSIKNFKEDILIEGFI